MSRCGGERDRSARMRDFLVPPPPYHASIDLPKCALIKPISCNSSSSPSSTSPKQPIRPMAQHRTQSTITLVPRPLTVAHFQRNGPWQPPYTRQTPLAPVEPRHVCRFADDNKVFVAPYNAQPLRLQSSSSAPSMPRPLSAHAPLPAVVGQAHAAQRIHIFGGALLPAPKPLNPTWQQRAAVFGQEKR